MRAEVLGAVRLVDDAGSPLEIPERKVRALLAALALNAGEAVPAETLISRVWGEELPGSPSRVLQAKLSQLRALLEQATAGGRQRVSRSGGGYRIELEGEALDAAVLRAAVGRAAELPADDRRAQLLESALELWHGRPYAEFADELWLSAEIADLEGTRLRGLELCAEALVSVGRPERAVALAGPALTEHPTREGLAAPLLLAYCRTRRQPEALAAYERLRGHLADELGIEPTEALQQLHLSILRQEPEVMGQVPDAGGTEGAADSRGAPEAPDAGGRLPAYASAFLGREGETQQVLSLLGEHRLITLLGVGGIGKTRLAVHAAGQLVHQSGAEAWFVDLTEVPRRGEEEGSPADRIFRMTAEALSLSSPWQGGEEIPARVMAALEAREALLVLDNCEHVIDEVAAFTDGLLRRASGVKVLATSREPMGLAEEQRLVVPQLPAEDVESAAAEFFMTRARAVNSAMADDAGTLAAAAELCRRLDGLPLALELAAARTSVLSVPDLLERITDRLDLFARPGWAAPRRQQTLRGMLDWSWELLDEQEQVLLRRLAVHPVLWRLDVIDQVCADSQRRPSFGEESCPEADHSVISADGAVLLPRRRVLGALTRLVECSLVSVTEVEGQVRYRLLETVGTYAAERLEDSGERNAVAARHIEYHRNLVVCAREFLFGPQARDWVRRIDEAGSHLSAAVAEALRRNDGAGAVALVLSTFWYRWMTGRMDSLVEELVAAADCPNPGQSPHQRRAHAQLRVLARTVEDRLPGEKVGQVLESLEAFDADEQGQLARMQVQWFASTVMYADAEHRQRGRRLADESIGYLLEAGDVRAAAFGSTQRDWFLLEFWEEPPQGMPDGGDAEEILRSHGDVYGLTQVLGVQHLWAEAQGRREESCRLAEEVLALSAELNLESEMAYWELVHAALRLREGSLDEAAGHLRRGHRIAQRVAFVYCLPLHDALAAMLAQRRGEDHRSQQLFGRMSPRDRVNAGHALRRYFSEEVLPAELQSSGRRRVSSTTTPASSSEVRA